MKGYHILTNSSAVYLIRKCSGQLLDLFEKMSSSLSIDDVNSKERADFGEQLLQVANEALGTDIQQDTSIRMEKSEENNTNYPQQETGENKMESKDVANDSNGQCETEVENSAEYDEPQDIDHSSQHTNNEIPTLVECPKCRQQIHSVTAFPCFHFLCGSCFEATQRKTTDIQPNAVYGVVYECPTCGKLASKEQVFKLDFVDDLLDTLKKAHIEPEMCETCDESIAVWRCKECKQSLCDQCKQRHDRFVMFKTHSGEPLENDSSLVDRHVFCGVHPTVISKLYCFKCTMIICVMCQATKHKGHKIAKLEAVLPEFIRLAQVGKRTIESKIESQAMVFERSIAAGEKIMQGYGNIETRIDQAYEHATQKLEAEYNAIKKQLKSAKDKHTHGMQQYMRTFELNNLNLKSTLDIVNLTLDQTKDMYQLQSLSSGVVAVAQHVAKIPDISEYTDPMDLVFKPTPELPGKTIGRLVNVTEEANKMGSYTNFGAVVFNEVYSCDSRYGSYSFTKIGDHLWHPNPNSNEIVITSVQNETLKSIQIPGAKNQCLAVLESHIGVLVATRGGLYLIDPESVAVPRIIQKGSFSDIVALNQNIYALEYIPGRVHILEYSTKEIDFKLKEVVQLEGYNSSDSNTIQVTAQHIFIALWRQNSIHQYNLDGRLTFVYGDQGLFQCPRLCGIDKQGILLISDTWNHRLLIMHVDGSILPLNVEVPYPRHALLCGNHLLVRHGHPDKNFKIFMATAKPVKKIVKPRYSAVKPKGF